MNSLYHDSAVLRHHRACLPSICSWNSTHRCKPLAANRIKCGGEAGKSGHRLRRCKSCANVSRIQKGRCRAASGWKVRASREPHQMRWKKLHCHTIVECMVDILCPCDGIVAGSVQERSNVTNAGDRCHECIAAPLYNEYAHRRLILPTKYPHSPLHPIYRRINLAVEVLLYY